MNILIIGGTRFVGHHTTLALSEDGHDVAVFTRGRQQVELPDGVEHIIGDREDDGDLERAAAARSWDVVWDNMSYTAEHAQSAVRVFTDRCRLFIHTSTLAVYSVCEGIDSPYSEDDFGRGRAREERREIYPYDYGIKRREGELVLQDAYKKSGFPFVSVRLPAVLGPRDYSLRGWSYWRRILEDGWIILPDRGIEMQRGVFAGDVVAAIRTIVARAGELAGVAYNIAGGEIVSLREFVELSAAVLGKEVDILGAPRAAFEAAELDPDKVSPYSTWGNQLQSIEKAQAELGFAPTPMSKWLPPTIKWHLEHRLDAEPPGWELRPQESKLAESLHGDSAS